MASVWACSISMPRIGSECRVFGARWSLSRVSIGRARVGWPSTATRCYGFFVVGSHSGQLGIPWSLLLVILSARARGGERIAVKRGVAITAGTWAAAHAVKRLDHRLRPCQDGDATPLVRCPKSSSLPSDEAACAFAAATYAAVRVPRLARRLYFGASFTAASRVYVGVHYPTDVAVGALLGTAIACAAAIGGISRRAPVR